MFLKHAHKLHVKAAAVVAVVSAADAAAVAVVVSAADAAAAVVAVATAADAAINSNF
jgi:hypothetical protein